MTRRSPLDVLLIYTICLVAFSSSMNNEYLTIPVAALAVQRTRWGLLYMAVASLYLATQYDGLKVAWLLRYLDMGSQDGPGVAVWHRLMVSLLILHLVWQRRVA